MIIGLFFFYAERNMSYKFRIRKSSSVLIVTKLIILKSLNYLTLVPIMEKFNLMLKKAQWRKLYRGDYFMINDMLAKR